MLIQIYDGIVDADTIVALTPVMKQDLSSLPGQEGIKMINKPMYVYQVTLTGGARINCTYEQKLDAEEERYFVLGNLTDIPPPRVSPPLSFSSLPGFSSPSKEPR